MSYLPEVAWSTIASNVTLGASAYRYYITVNPLDPNEAGASPMTVAINDWFIDFAGYPFLIEEVSGNILTVYDILERGDGVTSAYGPYANKLGYVYRPLNGAIILTQAQLRKLDQSAADIIQPIEKGIIWAHDFWEKDVDENIYQLNTGDVIVNRAIKFPTNVANPPYQEGLEFYDFGKHAMSYYNDEPNITVTKGQEVLIPVYNNTAFTIPNGKVVYPTGSILPDGETEYRHTVELADARYKDKCRIVAVATHDILPYSSGYATRLGSVSGLNTIGLSGQIYLSTDGSGDFTNTIPDDGAYIVEIGVIKNIHATEGSITVDPKSTTVHGNLTGLNVDDHKQYALLAGRTGDILKIDNIQEYTLDNGVTIDGVNIKDSEINFTYLDKYTNTTPMPVTVGGAEAGTTFNEQRIDQMLTAILYPYQYPAFTAFGISGQTTPIEVGNSIAANRTFTWTATNPANVATNSLVIRDVTGATNIETGVANDGSEATVYAAITKTTATTNVFSITGTNTRSQTFTRNYTVTWQWKVYYGESTTTPLVETNIEALRIGILSAEFAGTYTFNALSGGYKYLCYPSVLGTATSFKDTATQLPVPMETVYTVSVTNTYGVTTNYNVHRSTNILNDAINIIVA